jgi:hypothetical protein
LFREARSFLKSSVPELAEERARREIKKHTPRGGHVSESLNLPVSQAAKRVLVNAAEEAARLNHDQVGCEHLLLGLSREKDCLAAKLLREHGFDPAMSRTEIAHIKFARIGGEAWASFVTCAEAEAWGVLYHWEKRRCEPKDALKNRANQRLALYDGEQYDADTFDLVKGGWTDYRCAICWAELYYEDSPGRSFGYTNGQDWLCASC